MTTHHIAATPQTITLGIFDARIPPVVTIEPGDSVTMECLSGGPEVMPPQGGNFDIPAVLRQLHGSGLPRIGTHMTTGPVAIRGAEPGDVLEVRIDSIEPGMDWGYCGYRPLAGTLPEDFTTALLTHIPIDRARGMACLPWGPELPLRPFFGIMAVAPPPEYGRLSSKEPRKFGGNMDNRELVAGSVLYLPVWVEGANFSAGDGHGLQGDGEVCVNALETALDGRFTFHLHKAVHATMPRAETPTHLITMGFAPTLDAAMKQALREAIALVAGQTGWSEGQAYQTCSLAVDFRVTQTVNGEVGIHAMIPKSLLGRG